MGWDEWGRARQGMSGAGQGKAGMAWDGITIPRYLNVLKKMQNALNELMLTCREPPPGGIAIISTPVCNYPYPYCDYQHPRLQLSVPLLRLSAPPFAIIRTLIAITNLLRAAASQLRYRVHAAP